MPRRGALRASWAVLTASSTRRGRRVDQLVRHHQRTAATVHRQCREGDVLKNARRDDQQALPWRDRAERWHEQPAERRPRRERRGAGPLRRRGGDLARAHGGLFDFRARRRAHNS